MSLAIQASAIPYTRRGPDSYATICAIRFRRAASSTGESRAVPIIAEGYG